MSQNKKAIQPFDQTLRQINNGALIQDLTDELTEVIAAVQSTGKAGSLTLKLSFKPRGAANTQIELIPSVRGSKPELERPISIFFINSDNGLQREDPAQMRLQGLESVDGDLVDKSTGEVINK